MRNYWWLCSETVIAALQAIAGGEPDADPLINEGVTKFAATDGMSHFALFKSVSKDTKTWRVANVYGVTQEETDAYLARWPDDLELGGCWDRYTGRALCPQHADLLQYMPDDQDGNTATELQQVVMLPPQAKRQFN